MKLVLTLSATLAFTPLVSAQLDLNGDGLGDLWQLRYALTTSSPDADPDGDGMSNAEEEIAGTHPLDANSCFEVPLVPSADGESFLLNWNGVAGKQYSIQETQTLSNWDPTSTMISNGGSESVTLTADQAFRFWRISVRDVDTDGDGLTDAEERLLGYDPTDANSTTTNENSISGGDLSQAVSLLTTGETFSLDGGITVSGTSPVRNEVNRFLTQAVMGANDSEITALAQSDYNSWLEDQFSKPISEIAPEMAERLANDLDVFANHKRHSWWRQFITGDDPLRQRVTFALSQIYVISDQASLNTYGMCTYYDLLSKNAFGNVRQLLTDITLHPTMGMYLSHLKNRKADPSLNRFPDENYAREVMQLFTIGLFELEEDGRRKKDAQGNDIPSYDNEDITNFARVFTGLSHGGDDKDTTRLADFLWGSRNFDTPMLVWEDEHDQEAKPLLNGFTLPSYSQDPGRTGLDDINDTLDHLFNHPNTAPFLSRLLIQRLVTSNPSPGYIQRVAKAFADDGTGVRGNMKAIIKAILLDPEARQESTSVTAGRLREPFIRYARLGRIFNATSPNNVFTLNNWGLDSDLGQRWLSAPSVFNFYLPDHQPGGDLADGGLNGPEFQIMNAVTAIKSINYYRRKFDAEGLTEPWTAEAEKVNFQWDTELALTSDPPALIEHLNNLVAAGQLSERTQEIITTMVSTVREDRPHQRLRSAMTLIYLSPDFAIFR